MTELAVLHLGLTARGAVLAQTEPEYLPLLRRVQFDFPNADSFGRSAFEIDLGSFLANLSAIAKWTAGPVEWDQRLKDLAIASLDDSEHFDRLRADSTEPPAEFQFESDWTGDLTSFQRRDLARLLRMRHGANFSVPGAGKTRVALGFYSQMRAQSTVKRALVVAPKSAHESWLAETSASFADGRRVEVYAGGTAPECDILLVNYERLANARVQLAAFLSAADSLLVLDEAHRMKRGAGGVYGATCLSLGPLAKARLVLSGTPAPNGLGDLKSVLEFVWPGRGSRLFGVGGSSWSSVSEKAKPFFTRTTKSELDLPPLKTKIKRVDLPPLHREIYDALLGQLRQEVGESERIDDLGRIVVYLLMAATSPALLAVGSSRYEPLQFRVPPYDLAPSGKLRSLMADLPRYELSPKLLEASKIVRKNAKAGKKTVVWSTFIRNITTLENMLGDLGPQVVIGNTSDEERLERLGAFRKDESSFVLLTNPSTLGEGVSLHHECHDAVYIDRDFAAGRFLQSLDRIHRLGLEASVQTKATVLVASGTIDELVTVRLASKLNWMSDALDDKSLSSLADLEEERETADVLDLSDASLIRQYLGSGEDA